MRVRDSTMVVSVLSKTFLLLVLFGIGVKGSASTIITFKEGQNMTLPCEFTSPSKALYKIFWYKGETKILSKSFMSQQITIYLPDLRKKMQIVGQASLFLFDGDRYEHGVYSCHALYGDMTMPQKNITLFVEAHPIINSTTPAVQNITQGKQRHRELVLSCAVSAYPKPDISWTRVGKPSPSGKEGYNLVIKDPGKADSGTYTCITTNKMGTDAKNFTITVFELPQIIGKKKFHASIGEDAFVKCTARGNPEPTFLWSWKSSDDNTIVLKSGKEDGPFSVRTIHSNDSSQSVLEIKRMKMDDWKSYECEVENELGKDSAFISLTGKTIPDSPQIESVECISDQAEVKWGFRDDGGSPLISLTLQYKEKNSHSEWKEIKITPPNITRYTIVDLEPHTYYNFRILATNAIGISLPSATYLKKTTKSESTITLANGKDNSFFSNFSMTALIGAVAGGFFALLIAILAILCIVRKIQKNSSPGNSPNNSRPNSQEPSEMTTFLPQASQPVLPDAQQGATANPLCNSRWEFPRDRLDLQNILGCGAFGVVMKAQAAGIKGCVGSLTVAVKIVKDNDSETAKKDLFAELELLKLLEPHPNVIGLLGCCTRGASEHSLMLIVEYCHYGDLQSYMRHCRGVEDKRYMEMYKAPIQKLGSRDLLSFAIQVARGMSHLASMKVVHRDLAARNVLIDDKKVIKVADFGFARDIYVEDHYTRKTQGGRFPIKWMALESLLDGVSTSKSDVWSFGVLLWEIVTLGASPYPGMNSQEVINFLQDGYRMDKPKHCSEELYVFMLDCWQARTQHRLTFVELARNLSKMLSDEQEYIDMRMYENHLYINFDKTTGTFPSSGQSHNSFTAM